MGSHVLFSLASRAQIEELGWELWVSVALGGSGSSCWPYLSFFEFSPALRGNTARRVGQQDCGVGTRWMSELPGTMPARLDLMRYGLGSQSWCLQGARELSSHCSSSFPNAAFYSVSIRTLLASAASLPWAHRVAMLPAPRFVSQVS